MFFFDLAPGGRLALDELLIIVPYNDNVAVAVARRVVEVRAVGLGERRGHVEVGVAALRREDQLDVHVTARDEELQKKGISR
tara:strand:- start:153 stop:398 length:246 start_codon:yes stop_codon:yes gene_type:complete